MTTQLHFTGDADADKLLSRDPAALLTGMLLDQQFQEFWKLGSSARVRMGG